MQSVCMVVVLTLLTCDGGEARENKLTWMEKQSEENPVISMSSSAFRNYVNAGPRPYQTFVTFTSHDTDRPCHACDAFHEILVPVAETFHQARHESPPKTPVFFVEIDVRHSRDIFQALHIESAPMSILVDSTISKKTRDLSTFLERLTRDKYFQVSNRIEAADLFQFLTDRTRIQPIVKKSFPIPASYLIGGYAGLCVVVAFFGEFLWKHRRWFGYSAAVGTLVFFFYNVSGGPYNRIRETPWSYGNSWIVPQGRNQCQAEGLVIAGAYFGASLMAVLIIMSQQADSDRKDEDGKKRSRVKDLVMGLLKQFPSLFSLAGMIAAFYAILWIYSQKSPGYNLGRLQFSG